MREIMLTQGKVAIVDDGDYMALKDYRWCAIKSKRTYYAVRSIKLPSGKYRHLSMHTQIMGDREGYQIDHSNGDGLDNRRENLRYATHYQNHINQQARGGTSQYKGVNLHPKSKKWVAKIEINDVSLWLGQYDNEEDAAITYDYAARYFHGEYARLNFPD